MLSKLFAALTGATPAWLGICLIVACIAIYLQQRAIIRRLDKHAESIGHMDEWADEVEETITKLEEKSKRFTPTYLPARPQPLDVKRWWQK